MQGSHTTHCSLALSLTFVVTSLLPSLAVAQRFGSNMDITRSRIGDERVQRQSEVMRLERLLEGFETRLSRLERLNLRSAQFPSITIAEAEATVEVAVAQLRESEQGLEKGELSGVQVTADRLALVRAQGLLQSATAAFQEHRLALEMDVLYAERQRMQIRRERELAERMAAKGYIPSESLQFLILNEEMVQKELQLAKLRLQNLRDASGQESDPPTPRPDLTSPSKEASNEASNHDP